MNKILFLLLIFIFISGCTTRYCTQADVLPTAKEEARIGHGDYPDNYKEIVMNYLNEILIDPDSVKNLSISEPQKSWARLRQGHPPELGWVCVVRLNAKNRMGGYTGKTSNCALIRNGEVILFQEEYDYRHMYQWVNRQEIWSDYKPF